MKKIFKPLNILKTIALATLLFSCSNFMDSGEIKNEFDKSVDFANAPEIQVRIFSEQSETVPNGTSTRKHGEEFTVICNSYSDFQFVRWQVKDLSTGKIYSEEELKNIATFEDPNDSETMCTIIAPEKEIQIEPLCAERPHVLSEAPIFNNQGTNYRDASIMVMFDQPLDKGSIYYTAEELKALNLKNAPFYTPAKFDADPSPKENNDYYLCINPKNANINFLKVDDVTYEHQVYGYQKNGVLHFKNIEISDSLTKKSLLANFGGPYISGLYLLIPSYKIIPPIEGTQIQVDISPNVFCKSEDADIRLNVAKKWIYNVGSQTDKTAPTVDCYIFDSDGKEFKNSYGKTSYPTPTYDNFENIPKLKDGKLKLYARVSDPASGPSTNFKITLEQISNYKYEQPKSSIAISDYNLSAKNITNKIFLEETIEAQLNSMIPYTNLSSNQCYFGTEEKPAEIQFDDILQGIFKMDLTFSDMNNNETKKESYYFAMDKTPPALGTGIKQTASTENSVTVTWTNPSDADFKETIVKYRAANSNAEYQTKTVARNTNTCTLTGLTAGTNYEIAFEFVDIFGNSKLTSNNLEAYTSPNDITTLSASTSDTSRVVLTWTKPSTGLSTGYKIYYKLSSSSTYIYYMNTTATTCTVAGLSTGNKYDFMVKTYLGSTSWESSGTTVSQYTQPGNVSSLSVTSKTTNSETLSWTAPPSSDSATGYRIYYKLSSSSSYTYYTYTTSTTYTVSGLSAGNKYDFMVKTYLGTTSNESSGTTITSQYTKPDTVTNVSLVQSPSNEHREFTLTWTPPSTNFDGVMVFYNTNSDIRSATHDYTYSKTTKTAAVSKSTWLTPGTTYYTWIVTYAGSAPSVDSVKNGTSLNTSYVRTSNTTRPNPVTNLKVTSTGTTNETLSWTKPSTGVVTGYRIYYKLSSSSTYTYYTYTSNTSCTVSGLTAGNKYDFKVTSYAGTTTNESTGSTVSHYTRPNGVTNVKVLNNIVSATNMSLDISWTNPTSGNYAGTLFMLGTENDISKATYRGWEAPGVTSTNISVTPSTNYYVWVVTWIETSTSGSDINNDTRMSTTAVQAPILSSVSFKVEPASTKQIKISWTYPTSYTNDYYTYIYYGTSNTDMGNGKAKYLDYWGKSLSTKENTYSNFTSGTTYYFWIVTAPSENNLNSLLTTNNTSAFINKFPYHESTGWLNATAPY